LMMIALADPPLSRIALAHRMRTAAGQYSLLRRARPNRRTQAPDPTNGSPMAFAGLWERWTEPEASRLTGRQEAGNAAGCSIDCAASGWSTQFRFSNFSSLPVPPARRSKRNGVRRPISVLRRRSVPSVIARTTTQITGFCCGVWRDNPPQRTDRASREGLAAVPSAPKVA
jgi:hypothetical protein